MKRLALVVTGDRHAIRGVWIYAIKQVLRIFEAEYDRIVLIHGNAPGIDTVVGDEVDTYASSKWNVIPMPAMWDEDGLRAGPRRNGHMLQLQNILVCQGYEARIVAFHDDIENSKGTKDCLKQAKMYSLVGHVIGSDGKEL